MVKSQPLRVAVPKAPDLVTRIRVRHKGIIRGEIAIEFEAQNSSAMILELLSAWVYSPESPTEKNRWATAIKSDTATVMPTTICKGVGLE